MNRLLEKVNKAKESISKANILGEIPSRPIQYYKKFDHKPKGKTWNNNKKKKKKKKFNTTHSLIKNKKVNCFVCGKSDHYTVICRLRATNNYKGST
jgi:hypothetical protein